MSSCREQMETGSCFQRMIPYNHKLAPMFIRDSLYSIIPEHTQHIFVVGIGSSRINGDSLGPFVGTLLNGLYPNHLTVLGDLKFPLDATNLVSEMSQLHLPDNSFVVVIDSVLGSEKIVNSIVIREGAMVPGAALDQQLPPLGDCSVMGVVLENAPESKQFLLHTSLHLIYTMAISIAKGISLAVRQFFHYPSHHPLLRS